MSETRELTVSRVVDAQPQRVSNAFLDPAELAQWLHPAGHAVEIHHFDASKGGTYRISMATSSNEPAAAGPTYTGTFEELVPGERIVQTEVPDAPGMDGEMTVTITFEAVPEGTEVTVNIEIPQAWPDEAIGGWESALGNLATRLADA